jgi:hypothetical protein
LSRPLSRPLAFLIDAATLYQFRAKPNSALGGQAEGGGRGRLATNRLAGYRFLLNAQAISSSAAAPDCRDLARHAGHCSGSEGTMAAHQRPKRDKTYFKVSFTRDQELYQVCARQVRASDLYGLIEISEFVFPERKLVFNPGEDRLRREFEGIQRTFLPYHTIVRIDEVLDSEESESKIVPLQAIQGGTPQRPPEPLRFKVPET